MRKHLRLLPRLPARSPPVMPELPLWLALHPQRILQAPLALQTEASLLMLQAQLQRVRLLETCCWM